MFLEKQREQYFVTESGGNPHIGLLKLTGNWRLIPEEKALLSEWFTTTHTYYTIKWIHWLNLGIFLKNLWFEWWEILIMGNDLEQWPPHIERGTNLKMIRLQSADKIFRNNQWIWNKSYLYKDYTLSWLFLALEEKSKVCVKR